MTSIQKIKVRKNEANDRSLNTNKLYLKPSKDTTFVWGILTNGDDKYSIANGTMKDGIASVTIQKIQKGHFYYPSKGSLVTAKEDATKKIEKKIKEKIEEGYQTIELNSPITGEMIDPEFKIKYEESVVNMKNEMPQGEISQKESQRENIAREKAVHKKK